MQIGKAVAQFNKEHPLPFTHQNNKKYFDKPGKLIKNLRQARDDQDQNRRDEEILLLSQLIESKEEDSILD